MENFEIFERDNLNPSFIYKSQKNEETYLSTELIAYEQSVLDLNHPNYIILHYCRSRLR